MLLGQPLNKSAYVNPTSVTTRCPGLSSLIFLCLSFLIYKINRIIPTLQGCCEDEMG